ncbi:MAG: hypothetical protein M3O02_00335 [Acidobacteriota bacterium]|nr:hypothetical protein [Acidobacteriota bacterium]
MGRRTAETDASDAGTWSFDSMRRTAAIRMTINSITSRRDVPASSI